MSDRLFEEFPAVSDERWMEVVERDLKGKPFEKLNVRTPEGLAFKPFYRRDELPTDPAFEGKAGQAPYLRGHAPFGNDWAIRQGIRESDPAKANELARYALMRGAQQLVFVLYPYGVQLRDSDAFRQLLDGVFLEAAPIHFNAGPLALPTLALFVEEAERRNLDLAVLDGGLDFDPITWTAKGYLDAPIDEWKAALDPVLQATTDHLPRWRPLAINAVAYEEAGASPTLQLAIVLALLTEYLAGAGHDVDQLAGQTEIRVGVGSDYFLEIAKLRALRPLVQRTLEAFGANRRPKVHAITSFATKTIYDPYVNMLRVSTEAMAASVAGVDSISTLAFDVAYKAPDQFGERIARNVQNLLREEAYVNKVADPLGGSYAVENMTRDLAQAAWKLFQEIEGMGGFVEAWKAGWIQERIAESVAVKRKRVAQRRDSIVGVNQYPNVEERMADEIQHLPFLGKSKPVVEDFDALRTRMEDGTSLGMWCGGRPSDPDRLKTFRPAADFEQLRLRMERHEAKGGKRPVVFLAKLGDKTWRGARATFCLGFYGAGGYDVVEPNPFDTADAAARAANEVGADVFVLCSSDEEYLALAQSAKPALEASTKLVVAGNPKDAEALTAAGVDAFVHVMVPAYDTLKALHSEMGVTS